MLGSKKSCISIVIGLAAILGTFSAAPADVVETPLNVSFDDDPANQWTWDSIGGGMDTSDLDVSNGSGGWAVSDAERAGDSDYYDDFHGIAVDGTLFTSPGTTAERIINDDGVFLRSNSASMSGLNVSMEYFFSMQSPVIRAMAHFENASGSAITVNVRYGGDLGSDSSTTHEASASGDTVLDADDAWIVTSEGGTNEFNGLVLFGPEGGSSTPTSLVVDGDNVLVDYVLTVDAGQTASLMWFGYLATSTSDAVSFMGSNFSSNSALASSGFLAGLTQAQMNRVANYSGATVVPEPITLCTLGLGAAGTLAKRNRRR